MTYLCIYIYLYSLSAQIKFYTSFFWLKEIFKTLKGNTTQNLCILIRKIIVGFFLKKRSHFNHVKRAYDCAYTVKKKVHVFTFWSLTIKT